MKKKTVLYIVWAALYCLCVGFSFVDFPTPIEKVLLVLLGVAFFVPPAILVFLARKEKCRKTLTVLRRISLSVLALTLIFLVLNLLAVYFSATAGLVLYVLLVMFSAPMICIQYWALGIFLWAALFMLTGRRKTPYQM